MNVEQSLAKDITVVIVGPLAPPAGGMANQTKKLAEFLTNEGLNVDVIQVNRPYKPAWIEKVPGIRAGFRLIDYIVALYKELPKANVIHIMANSGWSWHLFAAPAILIGRQLGKAVVVNYRGGYARSFFDNSWGKVNFSLSRCQKTLVPSVFLQEVFADFGQHADIVPNVIDQSLFNYCKRTLNTTEPHLVVTRNLEDIYDVASAIAAFNLVKGEYSNARLSIAGTGPERSNLEAQVSLLGLSESVKFVGRLSPNEMANLYKSADILLNTSLVDNTPNSIIEALACGVPVVSTDVGGIPKLVTHERDALLTQPKEIEQLAALAISILSNHEMAKGLINEGLETVSKFYWENVWEALSKHYCEAIQRVEQ